MKNLLLKIPFLYNWINIKRLMRSVKPPVFLLYHIINNATPEYLKHVQYVKTVKEFENDLKFLQENFRLVSLEEILTGVSFAKPSAHLTFDDGLKECYEIIHPILQKQNIPATFFVNPAFVNNKDISHRYKISYLISYLEREDNRELDVVKKILEVNAGKIEIIHKLKQFSYTEQDILNSIFKVLDIDIEQWLNKHKPYMTIDQILKLKNLGYTIGVHGYNHAEFYHMSPEEQKEDIRKCINWIETNIHPSEYYFAFPFTDDQVTNQFYSEFTGDNKKVVFFGTAGLKNDPLTNSFQRIPVEYPGKKLDVVLKMEVFYYLLKKVVGKNIIHRKLK